LFFDFRPSLRLRSSFLIDLTPNTSAGDEPLRSAGQNQLEQSKNILMGVKVKLACHACWQGETKMLAKLAALLLLFATTPNSQPNYTTSDSAQRYQFASEFIDSLIEVQRITDEAAKNDPTASMENCIRNMESLQLEMNQTSSAMAANHLTGKVIAGVPQQIAEFYRLKHDEYADMQHLCETVIRGPKPGIDYGAITASAPKITARLNYLDESIFKLTPLVFGVLVSDTPDRQNHMSHLAITKEQMRMLARQLRGAFGNKLNAKTQNYTVSSASVLYAYLAQKGFKGSDEP
jgi:hypothetical protein